MVIATVAGKANTFLGMIHDKHSWRLSEKCNRSNESREWNN